MTVDKLYTGILHEAEYTEKMADEVLPYLQVHLSEAYVPCEEGEQGRKIHVLRYLAEKPRGVVVISHGFSESAQKYPEMVYYFLKEHFHVYLPEHCGHGGSYRFIEDKSKVCIDNWKRYIRDFLKISVMAEKAHPDLPLYCYAHSMGGGIAAAAAAWEPELYQKVVLSSPMIRALTGNVPWKAAVTIARDFCIAGHGSRYVAGQKPYDGKETFEDSSGLSRPRFERYSQLRKENPMLQTYSATYGWLYASARLYWYLRKRAWKRIEAPVLLLQAENDHLVSLKAQDNFARRINRKGKTTCRLIRMHGLKHELYSADDRAIAWYWGRIFAFLED